MKNSETLAPVTHVVSEFDPDPPTRAYVDILKSEIKDLRHSLASAEGLAKNATSNLNYWRGQYDALAARTTAPAEHVVPIGWVNVRVEDTGDGLVINADDAKKWNLKPDQHYEGRFLPDGTYRIAIPSPQPRAATKEPKS